jgi:hypothetical protein
MFFCFFVIICFFSFVLIIYFLGIAQVMDPLNPGDGSRREYHIVLCILVVV